MIIVIKKFYIIRSTVETQTGASVLLYNNISNLTHKSLVWTVSLLQDLWQSSRGAEEARGGTKKSRVSILPTECPTLQQSMTQRAFLIHQIHKIWLELISWSVVKVDQRETFCDGLLIIRWINVLFSVFQRITSRVLGRRAAWQWSNRPGKLFTVD